MTGCRYQPFLPSGSGGVSAYLDERRVGVVGGRGRKDRRRRLAVVVTAEAGDDAGADRSAREGRAGIGLDVDAVLRVRLPELVPPPAPEVPVNADRGGVIQSRGHLPEEHACRRTPQAQDMSPAGDGGVARHRAGVLCARFHLPERPRRNAVELAGGVVSPASQGAVTPDCADVRCARAQVPDRCRAPSRSRARRGCCPST